MNWASPSDVGARRGHVCFSSSIKKPFMAKKDSKASGENLRLARLIRAVCDKPRMYVGKETFWAAACFIEGFAHASESDRRLLMAFNRWVAARLGFPPNEVWIAGMENYYSDADELFRELPILFDEFLESGDTTLPSWLTIGLSVGPK